MAQETTSVAISKAHRFEVEDYRESVRAEGEPKPTVRSVVEQALDQFLEEEYTDLTGGDEVQGESASSVGARGNE